MSVQVKGSGTIGGLDEGLVVSGIVTSSTQINVGSNIKIGSAGVCTATSFVGGLPITSGADNRVITASSASAIQGEANLTFDGGLITGTHTSGNVGLELHATGNSIGNQTKYHNDHGEAYVGQAGDTTGNLLVHNTSNTNILFATNNTERLRINSSGNIQIGTVTNAGDALRYVDIANYNTGSSAGSILRLLTVKSDGSSSTSADIVKYKSGGLVINNNEAIGTTGYISFGTATGGGSTTERLRITSGGQVNIGSSAQTTHMLYLQGAGDVGIHLRADSDNSGENDNPYLSMSQDGSTAQELKIGQNGDAGQNFALSLANSPFIHANHSAAHPLQLAHMNTMCVSISSRHNELAINNYSGNTTGGMEIQNRGNDTATALKLTGHNNSGTPGAETFTQLTHIGSNLTFEIMHAGNRAFHIGSTRRIDVPAVYGTAISSPMRDLYVESTGQLGYDPSVRASKINIADNNDVSWLYNLSPKTYNKRKRVSKDTNEWTDEAESDLQYGLIAEDVESVNSNICFYDVDDSNNKTLAGVTYSQLITPLLKAIQEQKAEIETLKTKVAALEGS